MDTSALRSGSKRSFRDSDDDLVQQSRAHLILDPAAATSPQRRFEANPICGLGVLQFMTRRSTETLLEASPDLSRTMLLYFGLGIVGRLRAARRVGPLVGGEGDFWSPDNEDADDYIKFSRQTTSIIQERHADLEGVYSALRDAAVDAVQGVKRLWVGGAQSPDSVFLKRFVLQDAPRVHNNTSCCEVVRVGDVDLVFLHCKQALLPQTEKWASSAPVQPVPSNVAFDDPRTASHRAAHFGHVSCLDVLLRAGLPGNLPSDKTRSTPAHYCAIRGDVESLELLLRHGIDVSAAVDGQGRTPAVVAEACGHHDCRQWFATCGVPPQAAAA